MKIALILALIISFARGYPNVSERFFYMKYYEEFLFVILTVLSLAGIL